jgi:hypothetical protein
LNSAEAAQLALGNLQHFGNLQTGSR